MIRKRNWSGAILLAGVVGCSGPAAAPSPTSTPSPCDELAAKIHSAIGEAVSAYGQLRDARFLDDHLGSSLVVRESVTRAVEGIDQLARLEPQLGGQLALARSDLVMAEARAEALETAIYNYDQPQPRGSQADLERAGIALGALLAVPSLPACP